MSEQSNFDFKAAFAALDAMSGPRRESLVGFQVRPLGSWADVKGVVHAVNATQVHPDIDLGRETVCGSASWDPDSPRDYPVTTDEVVDCMTCVVRQARSCP